MGIEDGDFNWWDEGYGQDPSQWAGLNGDDLPSSPLQTDQNYGLNPYDAGNLPGGLTGYTAPSAVSGGSLIQRLLQGKNGVNPSGNSADLSSILGAFSSGEKANRVVQGNFTQNYDKLMLDAQDSRNKTESDALKKLSQTAYITGGGSHFTPPSLSLNGKDYAPKDLGFGPPPISDAEKAGASALQGQLQARLTPGGTYTPQPLDDYAKPGLAENIGSYGATGLGGLGAIQNMVGGQNSPTGVGSGGSNLGSTLGTVGAGLGLASKLGALGSTAGSSAGAAGGLSGALGTVGKFAGPITGAALGTYGLAKNQSVGSDVMSGMGAGASIGSMFPLPGIGTVIGAGVGALVGALRGAFSVTAKEQGGRDAQTQVAAKLKTLSTPQQQQEAAHAGWPDPNQALSLIVMRDKLTQSGIPPAQAESQAEQYMHSIWDAEKSGSQAVASAASPIQSMMGTQFNQSPTATGSGGTYPPGTDAFSRGARI